MSLRFHWFLPTNGDGRDIVGGGHGVATGAAGAIRPASLAYLGQIARSAEQLGFEAALTPTGAWCEDAWLATAMLTEVTERLKFLVAFRPGLISPTLSAQMAATFQRFSKGRLLLNVVTGGESAEQRAYGDFAGKAERYERCGEFLNIVTRLWAGETVDFDGEHLHVEGARLSRRPVPVPDLYFGGSSAEAGPVAARYTDVYLTWGEPPAAVETKLRWIAELAAPRPMRFGVRLHVISRDTAGGSMAAGRPADRGRRRGDDPPRSRRGWRRVSRRACGGCVNCTAGPGTAWRSPRTCGRASAWSAAVPGPRWSAATRRSPTGSRSTPDWVFRSSSCPGTRTWRRRTGSARACCPSWRRAASGVTRHRRPSTGPRT